MVPNHQTSLKPPENGSASPPFLVSLSTFQGKIQLKLHPQTGSTWHKKNGMFLWFNGHPNLEPTGYKNPVNSAMAIP
jgi:hypothetical protein